MNAQPSLFDPCAGKHGGNVQSVAANLRAHPHKVSTRERIRVFIGGTGFYGATLAEICQAFGKLPHQLSGRITELKASGEVFDSGRVRSNHAVLVGKREWVNG